MEPITFLGIGRLESFGFSDDFEDHLLAPMITKSSH